METISEHYLITLYFYTALHGFQASLIWVSIALKSPLASNAQDRVSLEGSVVEF
jgi:hypothetical protein